MATIRKEFRSARSANEVWAVLRRFDAVHELAPGFVTTTKMEPSGARVVTFANGIKVREWLVTSDDASRRLVYAITDSPNYTHYQRLGPSLRRRAEQQVRLERGFPAGFHGRDAECRHGGGGRGHG